MQPGALLEANRTTGDSARAESPGSVLARFLELRGRRIVKACGALWYTVPGRFLMSLPYQKMLDPDPAELRSMIRDAGACGARFPSQSWSGLESGLYLLRRRDYTLASLHAKHRPRVRHAMPHFEVRLAEKSQLLEQGCALNLSTMARQNRYDAEFGERRRWAALRGSRLRLSGSLLSGGVFGLAPGRLYGDLPRREMAAHPASDVAAGRPAQLSQSPAHLHRERAGLRRSLRWKPSATATCRCSPPTACMNTSCASATK